MKNLAIEYSHEFISNKIKDELILNKIWDINKIEESILNDLKLYFSYYIGTDRNINTLSGGQRAITYLVTLAHILEEKNIKEISLTLNNIIESLTKESGRKILGYLNNKGVYVAS